MLDVDDWTLSPDTYTRLEVRYQRRRADLQRVRALWDDAVAADDVTDWVRDRLDTAEALYRDARDALRDALRTRCAEIDTDSYTLMLGQPPT